MANKKVDVFTTYGETGLKRSGGLITEEWHTKLKGVTGRKKYREMADMDCAVGTSLSIIEMSCRRPGFKILPYDETEGRAVEYADYISECFDDMRRPYSYILSDILTQNIFGWSALEKIFKIRKGNTGDPKTNSKFSDGKYGWCDWGIRAQESLYNWVFDEFGDVKTMVQQSQSNYKIMEIPEAKSDLKFSDKMLLFRVKSNKGNPEGYSPLRCVYSSYYFATKLNEIMCIGYERLGGLPIMEVPPEILNANSNSAQSTAKTNWEAFVKKVCVDAYMGALVPASETPDGRKTGYNFRLEAPAGRGFDGILDAIKMHVRNIYQAFCTEFLGLGGETGSWALSSDKTSFFLLLVDSILSQIDEIINRDAIPQLLELNGMDMRLCPYIKHNRVETRAIAEVLGAINTAVTGGAMVGDDSVNNLCREVVGLEPMEDNEYRGLLSENLPAINNEMIAGKPEEEPEEPEEND